MSQKLKLLKDNDKGGKVLSSTEKTLPPLIACYVFFKLPRSYSNRHILSIVPCFLTGLFI